MLQDLYVPHFGETISRLRNTQRLSQEELGEKSGLGRATIQNIEKLESATVRGTTYRKLASGLGLTVDQLDREWRAQKIEQSIGDPVQRGIPVINRAPAGKVTNYEECSITDSGQGHWYVHRAGIEDPNAFAVIVTGNSMEPTLMEGAICIFSPMDNDGHTHFRRIKVEEGHIIFIRFSSDSRFEGCAIARWHRKGEKMELRKDNKAHKGMSVEPEEVARIAALVRYDPLPGVTAMFHGNEQNQSFGGAETQIEGQIHPDYD